MLQTTDQPPGLALRRALAEGWRPEPQPTLIALGSTEQAYASAEVEVLQFGGGEPGGSLGQPASDSAPGWIPVDHGTVYLTSHRFALRLRQQFANVPYQSVADAYCHHDGVCVWQRGRAPLKFRLEEPEWHFVLFRWLAYGEGAQPATVR